MLTCFGAKSDRSAVPIYAFTQNSFKLWLEHQDPFVANWSRVSQFEAKANQICKIPDRNGQLNQVLLGLESDDDFWAFGGLPADLPSGSYRLENLDHLKNIDLVCLAWGLGSYCFQTYRTQSRSQCQLEIPSHIDGSLLHDWVNTIYLIRDLINTPAEDMTPADLADVIVSEGKNYGANTRVLRGEQLLSDGYPAVYTVGRGSVHAPHFIDLQWGNDHYPKVTLVGKGVCFDTGGLDLKSSSGMLLMKKDMGGAAHMLGLARMVMAYEFPIRLRLLVPAVENAIGADSYRPSDVLNTRAGLTVEITNTDAEGRVILADALAEADRENPDCLIDFSTLTGAARVALGPQIPVFFTPNQKMARNLIDASEKSFEPIWRLPLAQQYRHYLKSNIADLVNSGAQSGAGAITAALFLQRFVKQTQTWAHFDLMAWNPESLPGRPLGGEAQGLRTLFCYLQQRYGSQSI